MNIKLLSLIMLSFAFSMNQAMQPKADSNPMVAFTIKDKEHLYDEIEPQIKEKYVLACPILNQKIQYDAQTGKKDILFKHFDTSLFAFLKPCLKLNYHLHKYQSENKKEARIKNFRYLLATCGQENIADIIDLANMLDLKEPLDMAVNAMAEKFKKQSDEGDDYIEKGLASLKLRFGSSVKNNLNDYLAAQKKLQALPKQSSWYARIKNWFYKNPQKANAQSKSLVPYQSPVYKTEIDAIAREARRSPSLWAKIKNAVAFILWR